MRRFRSGRLAYPFVAALLAIAVPLATAFAAHQFSDVPTSHPFHYDIDALVDSGVTAGCGGGKFCPAAYVTRGQMAAFLNRLGALAPDKSPVVNADAVDGIDGLDLMSRTGDIPSGMTVTGYAHWYDYVPADNAVLARTIELPGRAHAPFVGQDVNFAPDTHASDDDATCTGSDENPTAPPGKVCIYVASWANADEARGDRVFGLSEFGDRYFVIIYQSNAPSAGNVGLEVTWAYTAP